MTTDQSHGFQDMGPTLEPEQLNALLGAAGPDGVRDIMEAFWRSTDQLIAAMREQADGADFAEAARTAHALKGSAANIGAALLTSLARAMEAACKAGDAPTLLTRVEQAQAAVGVTRTAIDDLIAAA